LPWRRTSAPVVEIEMSDSQVGHLLSPCPGVVEEQQQGAVSQGEASYPRELSEQRLDLVALEEVRLGRRRRFMGLAATCWQTPSISGSRLAM